MAFQPRSTRIKKMKNLEERDGSLGAESQPLSTRDVFQTDTCVGLYLRDIRRVRRLTPQEEMGLAIRTRNGNKDAREQMIIANLPLAIKIVRAYEGMGLPLLDLISEGNIGLMRALERFDPHKGVKFSDYAALWIKQAITKALASQSKSVRLPTHVLGKLSKIRRAASRPEEELGREPTDEELASEMGNKHRKQSGKL
jgi:RNA polymerase primary sigma factor